MGDARRVSRWRVVRRVVGGLALLGGLAWLGLHVAARGVFVAHPIGATRAGYGYVEVVPARRGPRPLVLWLHGAGSVGGGGDPGHLVDRAPFFDVALGRLWGRRSRLFEEGAIVVAPQSP